MCTDSRRRLAIDQDARRKRRVSLVGRILYLFQDLLDAEEISGSLLFFSAFSRGTAVGRV